MVEKTLAVRKRWTGGGVGRGVNGCLLADASKNTLSSVKWCPKKLLMSLITEIRSFFICSNQTILKLS